MGRGPTGDQLFRFTWEPPCKYAQPRHSNVRCTCTSLLLSPRCCYFQLLFYFPHPPNMPRRKRRTKGRAKTEEFYRINKVTSKQRRHDADLGNEIVATGPEC